MTTEAVKALSASSQRNVTGPDTQRSAIITPYHLLCDPTLPLLYLPLLYTRPLDLQRTCVPRMRMLGRVRVQVLARLSPVLEARRARNAPNRLWSAPPFGTLLAPVAAKSGSVNAAGPTTLLSTHTHTRKAVHPWLPVQHCFLLKCMVLYSSVSSTVE